MTLQATGSRRTLLLLSGITLAGAILRFYNYQNLTLFNDELSALTRLRYDNFADLIRLGVMPDMHPAGIQVFLWFLTRLFGNSEAVVRLPFVLAGIGSIPLVYAIGKRWFSEQTGLLSAACLAVLQYPVYFSQMARPYSMGLFFCLLTVYFMGRIIDSASVKKSDLAGFVLAGVACMYIHYFSFLFAGIAGFTGIFLISRERRKKYLLAGVAMVVLALPHWPVYKHQLLVGGLGGPEGWLGAPDEDAFRNYLFYVFNDSRMVALLLWGTGIASFVYYRKTLNLSRYHLVCLLFFLMPFGIAYYYSIWKNPVFQYSILLFSFPYLLLILFSFIPADLSLNKFYPMLLLFPAAIAWSTIVEKKYYSTEHYGVFRQLAERTVELNNSLGDRNITNTFNVYNPYYLDYYFAKFKRPVTGAQYRCMEADSLKILRDIVNRSTTPYFLHAWSNIYEPPEADEIIRQQYPFRIIHDRHINSALSLYARSKPDSARTEKIIFSATHDFEHFRWPNDQYFMSREPVHGGSYSSDLSGKEYGNTFITTLSAVGYEAGCILSVSCWIYPQEVPVNTLLVVTVQDRDEKTLFWQAGKAGTFITGPDQWQQFFFSCILPSGLPPYARLKIFPWNRTKQNTWIDDLEITIRKGNQ